MFFIETVTTHNVHYNKNCSRTQQNVYGMYQCARVSSKSLLVEIWMRKSNTSSSPNALVHPGKPWGWQKERIRWNGPGFWCIFNTDQQESTPVCINITPGLNEIDHEFYRKAHIVQWGNGCKRPKNYLYFTNY